MEHIEKNYIFLIGLPFAAWMLKNFSLPPSKNCSLFKGEQLSMSLDRVISYHKYCILYLVKSVQKSVYEVELLKALGNADTFPLNCVARGINEPSEILLVELILKWGLSWSGLLHNSQIIKFMYYFFKPEKNGFIWE